MKYILLILLILIIIILISKVKINLMAKKDGENDHIVLNIKALFGLIKIEKVIPFVDIINSNQNLFETLVSTDVEIGNIDIPVGEKKDKALISYDELRQLKEKIEKIYKTYGKTINYIRKKIFFEKILWNTQAGTGDAAETAIITGILWALKTSVLSLFNNKINISSIKINVNPIYDKTQLITHLNCIISLKIGYIIIACIKLVYIKIILEVGEKIEHTSH